MMDESTYSSHLLLAVNKTLSCLLSALQGIDNQEGAAGPYRLTAGDLRTVKQHANEIINTVGAARLEATQPAKARTAAADRTHTREPYRRRA